jgi:hypothetical protein
VPLFFPRKELRVCFLAKNTNLRENFARELPAKRELLIYHSDLSSCTRAIHNEYKSLVRFSLPLKGDCVCLSWGSDGITTIMSASKQRHFTARRHTCSTVVCVCKQRFYVASEMRWLIFLSAPHSLSLPKWTDLFMCKHSFTFIFIHHTHKLFLFHCDNGAQSFILSRVKST